jgi:hypothetical protein
MTSIQPEHGLTAPLRPSRSTRPPSVPSCCTRSATAKTSSPSWPLATPPSGSPPRDQPGSVCTRTRSAVPPAAPCSSSTTQTPSSAGPSPPGPPLPPSQETSTAGGLPGSPTRSVIIGKSVVLWAPVRHLDRDVDRQPAARVWPAIQHPTRSPRSAPITGGGLPPRTPPRSAVHARHAARKAMTQRGGRVALLACASRRRGRGPVRVVLFGLALLTGAAFRAHLTHPQLSQQLVDLPGERARRYERAGAGVVAVTRAQLSAWLDRRGWQLAPLVLRSG